MPNDKLAEQSMDFSVLIINPVKELKLKHESVISNQIGRSGKTVWCGHLRLCGNHRAAPCTVLMHIFCRLKGAVPAM